MFVFIKREKVMIVIIVVFFMFNIYQYFIYNSFLDKSIGEVVIIEV